MASFAIRRTSRTAATAFNAAIVSQRRMLAGVAAPDHLSGPFIGAKLPQIDIKKLQVIRTQQPRTKLPKEQLKFGQLMSDHLAEVNWNVNDGWLAPVVRPYGPLSLDPAASVFHYALECFEGMKGYVDKNDNIRLFRPDKNLERLNRSAHRLLLPGIDKQNGIELIAELVRQDKDWIPRGRGYSLYIRPTLISTHANIGVAPPLSAKFFIITSPVGPYYPGGFAPIAVYAEDKYVRAWPGGVGDSKVGGNYAVGIRPAYEAAVKGFSQILWLVGKEMYVSEVGTMNQFFFWKRRDGKNELVTAPLDGTILPGITRMSILELCKEWGEFEVSERNYTMQEIIDAVKEDRMIEAFGAGTAAIVAPVNRVAFKGVDYHIPLQRDNPQAKAGRLTERIFNTLMDIQYGEVEHPWSMVIGKL